MPTFYDCYQRFLKRKKAVPFGRQKLKLTGYKVSKAWDRKHDSPTTTLPMVESNEGGKLFMVRSYPDDFVKVIDAIIIRSSNLNTKPPMIKTKPAKEQPLPFTDEVMPPEPAPIEKPKKVRKRIPAKK